MSMIGSFLAALFLGGPFDLSKWNPPVLNPLQIEFRENNLVVLDAGADKVRLYGDLESHEFLWETPGLGQGPGEFESPPKFIAIDPEGGLWVSHIYGIHYYGKDGEFKGRFAQNIGIVCIAVDQHRLYRTWGHGWRDSRPGLTAYEPTPSLEKELWSVANVDGIAYMSDGTLIAPSPVVFVEGDVIHYLRPFHKEYLKIRSSDGLILLSAALPVRSPPKFEAVGRYTNVIHGAVTVQSFEHCSRGWVRDPNGLWVGLPDYIDGEATGALVCLDTDTGKMKQRLKPGIGRFQLVTIRQGVFLLLDKNEGQLVWWTAPK